MYDSTDLKKAHLLSYTKYQFVHKVEPEDHKEGPFVANVGKTNRLLCHVC